VADVLGLWQIVAETNGYLIVRQDKSLLIDCPSSLLDMELAAENLPAPSLIIHTQVQEEHCREWGAFPETAVAVSAEAVDIATRSPRFFAECQTVWPPSRAWETRGAEKYGFAGCPTERPPLHPLAVRTELHPGDVLPWAEGVTLEVLALPGSGKRSLGFYWQEADILFSGDLLVSGGHLANLYDCEREYGLGSGMCEVECSLETIRQLQPRLLLPTLGPLITDPDTACRQLLERLSRVRQYPARWADAAPAMTNYQPRRILGRYREVMPGIVQSANGGNIILFIDERGRGCIIDPDPCIWLSWEESCREVHADFDMFERELGLRTVEYALITHYHGDHVQFCDLLRARYGTRVAATPDVAAVMERPEDYRYPSALDWYGFPFTRISVDTRLSYTEPLCWHDIMITPLHTPGHCWAHTGFLVPWQGLRTVCTGDTLQYGAGPYRATLPVLYSDTAYPLRGIDVTLRRLAQLQPDLVLGGHSASFFDRDGAIIGELLAAEEAFSPLVMALAAEGTIKRAMTPPGYNAKRPFSK
jgi:glyoxylase-like metal-dependent hydrolase (beta-lactamase superfamily II)